MVGAIHVVNHEVFSARDGYFRLANLLHRTTREDIIRREVLLRPGQLYDEALVEETVRNLRDADFSSLVAIVPVVERPAGQGRSAGRHPRRLEPALQHRLRVPAAGAGPT